MKRRTILGAGIGIAAAGTLGLFGMRAATPYTPERALRRGKLTTSTHELRFGSYSIRLSPSRFELRHGRDELWTSDGPFLAAGTGRKNWRNRLGHFTSHTELDAACVDQRVTSASATDTQATLTGELFSGSTSFPYALTFTRDPYGLETKLSVPGADFTCLRIALGPDEEVHGAGEQFTGFSLRGYAFPLLPREQGIGRGRQPLTILAEATNGTGGSPTTTYAPIPFLITDAMRSISWANDEVAEVDLRETNRLDLTVWGPTIDAYLENAGDPPTLLRSHTRRTGRMGPLPEWSGRGAILGLQGGTEQVRTKLKTLVDAKAAVSAIWLCDWTGSRITDAASRSWWTWELDPHHYPGWDDLVRELTASHITVMSYVSPCVVNPDDKPVPVRRNLFKEGSDNGFFVKTTGGRTYLLDQGGFDAAMVDLTNPAARAWFGEVIATQVAAVGIGGWIADLGEGLPFDAILHSGTPGEWHNRWPTAWAELNKQVRDKLGGQPRLVAHRSAWRGSPSVATALWAGEQMVDWHAEDGMTSALFGILNGGISGLTINHADIGGHTGLDQAFVGIRRTAELLIRWAEWAAWTPLFRTNEGSRPDEQIQAYHDEVRTAFAAQSRVFAALTDYRDEVLAQASSDGLPAMRHCWVHHPTSIAATRADQYFYGDRFLVAPMLGPGGRHRDVAFPPGQWVHVWTGASFAGNQQGALPAPFGQTPIFYRADDTRAASIAGEVRRAAL